MFIRCWTLVVVALLLLSAPAWPVPTTVQLRVEGDSSTIFEGPVTTGGKMIDKGDGPHPCDGTNLGANPSAGPTMTSALDDGSIAGGFTWDGTWFPGFEDFLIDRIGPDASDFVAFKFWGTALNFQPSSVGGCQQQVTAGDEVLFAYDFFSKIHLLKLAGPTKAATGQAVNVTVTDGQDGSKIAGAGVGGTLTGADGTAALSFDSPGLKRLKAERADSVRSNAVEVCVYVPGSGACDTSTGQPPTGQRPVGPAGPGKPVRDSKAPSARISSPRSGVTYRRGPRLLRGTASDDESGVSEVKLALRRHVPGENCRWWSGRRERFVGNHCHKIFFFLIGDDADWSYLLPRPLPPGHYVLDVKAFDRVRNRDEKFERGRNRIVFDVARRGGSAARVSRARGVNVDIMVVGKSRTLVDARTVHARAAMVLASGRRCRVAAGTPLAALARALRLSGVGYHVRDFGHCLERRASSSGQLFVDRVGSDRNSGQNGWFYKVNQRAGTSGAADPSGPFGTGFLGSSDRVIWFYCVFNTRAGSCQQTLELVPSATPGRAGEILRVGVRGYGNDGKGRPVSGATITLGSSSALTDQLGAAELRLAEPGLHLLRASKTGAIPAYPIPIRVR